MFACIKGAMAQQRLVIIDYGSGNLRSAAKAFEHVAAQNGLSVDIRISARAQDIATADRIVLPGQGAFGDCMAGLRAVPDMVETLNEAVLKRGTPFLGICVGMQLMAARGLEHGVHAGLNWIAGDVVPMSLNDPGLKIPHMGWNELVFLGHSTHQDNKHFVLRSTENGENFYFVHSFVFQCVYKHHVLGYVEYGGLHPAVVGRDNMIGMQFHPEKSHEAGLKLLSEFMMWSP